MLYILQTVYYFILLGVALRISHGQLNKARPFLLFVSKARPFVRRTRTRPRTPSLLEAKHDEENLLDSAPSSHRSFGR